MSERAVQILTAIAEPFHGMFKDLVERRRNPTGILRPGLNARVARRKGDSEVDFSETSELFSHNLDGAVGDPNDVISLLESFTSDAGTGTGEGRSFL